MARKDRGPAPKDYSESEVLAALQNSYGIVSRVAEKLSCNWNTAKKYIEMYPSCQQSFLDETERVLDLAESKIIKSINMDDVGTAKWLLSTKGKLRGYSERMEVSGKDGAAIETKNIIVMVHGQDSADE